MIAVIHQVPNAPTKGMLNVAGRPLVDRQLEWLFAAGCERVVVELGEDAAGAEVATWLAEDLRFGREIRVVSSGIALGPREAARLADVDSHAPLLALPADMLCRGDLGQMHALGNPGGVIAFFDAPHALARDVRGGTLRLVRAPIRFRQPAVMSLRGWAVRFETPRALDCFNRAVDDDTVALYGDDAHMRARVA